MKLSLLAGVLISICFCWAAALGSEDRNDGLRLASLLPRAGDVEGWVPEGEASSAEGEDLYLLINGGAEIYREYGFKEAVFQTYGTANGKSINLEIYEMENETAAYGMYTYKTGEEGTFIGVGHDGWFESYYLNFWKGNFLVTVVGLGTDTTTFSGVEDVARAVDKKLKFEPKKPRITSYLPKENLRVNGVTYLKGNLALSNQYFFDENNIFGLKEGVIGRYDRYSVFIFQYSDQNESAKWYGSARNHLEHSPRFNGFLSRDAEFEISDTKNNRLSVKHYREWILIILGIDNLDTDRIFGLLEVELSQSTKDE
ncbi:MAG: hypothetical protein JSW58_04420 [Candidatus Latescibacterota bacterium]|nr:MAG: hypothetical protein JSW58_04420 [Candidatus Latescibacterota bacterium]